MCVSVKPTPGKGSSSIMMPMPLLPPSPHPQSQTWYRMSSTLDCHICCSVVLLADVTERSSGSDCPLECLCIEVRPHVGNYSFYQLVDVFIKQVAGNVATCTPMTVDTPVPHYLVPGWVIVFSIATAAIFQSVLGGP